MENRTRRAKIPKLPGVQKKKAQDGQHIPQVLAYCTLAASFGGCVHFVFSACGIARGLFEQTSGPSLQIFAAIELAGHQGYRFLSVRLDVF